MCPMVFIKHLLLYSSEQKQQFPPEEQPCCAPEGWLLPSAELRMGFLEYWERISKAWKDYISLWHYTKLLEQRVGREKTLSLSMKSF